MSSGALEIRQNSKTSCPLARSLLEIRLDGNDSRADLTAYGVRAMAYLRHSPSGTTWRSLLRVRAQRLAALDLVPRVLL